MDDVGGAAGGAPRPPRGDWLGSRHLRLERRGRVVVVHVERAEARNAMTGAMYFGIRYAVDLVNRSADLDGLVVTGTDDVFVCGGDLAGARDEAWMDFGLLGMDVTPFDALRNSAKPVVSAVNGLCQGGGLVIALLSDVAVAARRATFRTPELLRGIADMSYASVLATQVGPGRARDLLLTGRTLDAVEAEAWGLVTRVVPDDEVLDAALDAVAQCVAMAPDAWAAVKRGVNAAYPRYDRMTMDRSLAGPEVREGFEAFLERRPPRWRAPE